ncbi:hypothetical protein T492DRAFT_943952 [Pavlovales sp. CCMP2436]|nr:hypothetical protein T492DRAFT_943952 [Pavlovales sp. CCMP2436]|mmetsp:Transcript_25295/g.64295  ORF Transcript_25295/g.64295 Transcript_25295/m.64295 type:complete len:269 (-) Transcript_25295:190-996(-)
MDGSRCFAGAECDCAGPVSTNSSIACVCDLNGESMLDDAEDFASRNQTACLECSCPVETVHAREHSSADDGTPCQAGPCAPPEKVRHWAASPLRAEYIPLVILAVGIAVGLWSFYRGRYQGRWRGRAARLQRPAPLDADALVSKLPVIAFALRAPTHRVFSTAECSICLSAYAPETRVTELGRCGHLYCAECISAWVRNQAKRSRPLCPLCKEEIFEVEEAAVTTPAEQLQSGAVAVTVPLPSRSAGAVRDNADAVAIRQHGSGRVSA